MAELQNRKRPWEIESGDVKDSDFILSLVAVVVLSLSVGINVIQFLHAAQLRKQLIEKGYGQYNPKTAKWELK